MAFLSNTCWNSEDVTLGQTALIRFHGPEGEPATSATYKADSSPLIGTLTDLSTGLDGRVLMGTWTEPDTPQGTLTGDFAFLLEPDGKSFSGVWTMAGFTGPKRPGYWNGTATDCPPEK